ncbi:anaerobic coproporphyrinogen III oxidase [Panacagrimonas perspica]|uniref:Heme chaperone HemW n=1 Tax=Panacagrimonas perspica TaxID=381431 RepID=A0A4S3K8I3_9GAMM|nr:radical SAM family heme chaperone HemW [Panacagrimonas perspica]TDU26735.1 anaerobic coproporphyrinogen III oxidase [Panacagrimonas perspica]THD04074.1 YggW family oxidoreductase [Panacagrimonas perspica]
MSNTDLPLESVPLSLYVHLPWCARKCPYCDFNSHAARGVIPEREYVDALIRDLEFELSDAGESRPLRSIFFGGGTPSLFSGAAIGRVLDAVAARLKFANDIEITLEANPGTADAANFRGYRAAGVNRMSIGVQSFDPAHLAALGRIHSGDEARRAFAMARDAGFDNLNLDLMFALPQQTQVQALADLHGALALQPEHLSWYHLTLEPNTEFAARPPAVPDADTAADMHDAGCALLADAGFAHYETSAFARPGLQSRHNLNYWRFGDYLGIGAGAHAKRTAGKDLRIERRARHKHPRTYMETAGTAEAIQERRVLAQDELPFEFCMNALRLHDGFIAEQFESRTGAPFSALSPMLAQALRLGLVEPPATDAVRPTEAGRRYQNRLFELFL